MYLGPHAAPYVSYIEALSRTAALLLVLSLAMLSGGHFSLEQNADKRSKWSKLAGQAHDIAWEFKGSGHIPAVVGENLYTLSGDEEPREHVSAAGVRRDCTCIRLSRLETF